MWTTSKVDSVCILKSLFSMPFINTLWKVCHVFFSWLGVAFATFKTTVFSREILRTFCVEIIPFLVHICFFIAFPYWLLDIFALKCTHRNLSATAAFSWLEIKIPEEKYVLLSNRNFHMSIFFFINKNTKRKKKKTWKYCFWKRLFTNGFHKFLI